MDPSGLVSAGTIVAQLRHGPVEQGYELRGGPWAVVEPIFVGKANESSKIRQKKCNQGDFVLYSMIMYDFKIGKKTTIT